jgi:Methyltransferase domain
MQPSFLQNYLKAFHRIRGWFSYDAALMFMAYNQLNSAAVISGDTLEIGVYHGLSAIAIASLRGAGRKMYAIDLFEELESDAAYGSGASYRRTFEENIASFYGADHSIVPVTGASGKLKPADFGRSFSFCHVDGGHSPEETDADLRFASEILMPGGLLALDDYFNPQHPGVCEGAIEFSRRNEGVLQPLAIGYNKVLFQKKPSRLDLNSEFLKAFPAVERLPAGDMWSSPIFLFTKPFREHFDLYASTPQRLVPLGDAGIRATFAPGHAKLRVGCAKTQPLPVVVRNVSGQAFPAGQGVLGLSYHLLSERGETLQHDNHRTYFPAALEPGQQATLDLRVAAPASAGLYRLEIDLVWEGVMWFKEIGNPTRVIELEVG